MAGEIEIVDLNKIKNFFDEDFSRYLKIRINFHDKYYRKTICSLIYGHMNTDRKLTGAEKIKRRNDLSAEFFKKDEDYISDFIYSVKEILKIKY